MRALHILFSPSAAVDLRRALATVGKDDLVAAMADDLSIGPIDPPGRDLRAEWVEQALGYTGWDLVGRELDQFWSDALSDVPHRVAWVSRRSTMEFCGFLEWLRRNGERPCSVVDLTDVSVPSKGATGASMLAPTTGLIHHDQFAGARLWELAMPLPAETRVKWLELWKRLRSENAPLRVLTSSGLQSAPLDVFDEQILSYVGVDWTKAALAVGRFLYASTYESFCAAGVHQTGDMVPIARIAAMIDAGRIEARGNPYELQTCTIRRRGDDPS